MPEHIFSVLRAFTFAVRHNRTPMAIDLNIRAGPVIREADYDPMLKVSLSSGAGEGV